MGIQHIIKYLTVYFRVAAFKNLECRVQKGTFAPKYQNMIRFKNVSIWQRRYWEHIIRDTNDLYKHLDYIHYNPIKHGYVIKTNDWKYSSFNKFVKLGYYDENWCNFEDKNEIKEFEFE